MKRVTVIITGLVVTLVITVLVLIFVGKDRSSIPRASVNSVAETTHEVWPEVNGTVLETSDSEGVNDVWDICGLADYPTKLEVSKVVEDFEADMELSETCLTALERHLFAINPLIWRGEIEAEYSFLTFDYPVTFERLFSDPKGDLERVVEALSRPECLLENSTQVNWELKETCHADAFMNYAEFYHFCYFDTGIYPMDGVDYRVVTTPKQRVRVEWKSLMEYKWIKNKCKEFDSSVKIGMQTYPEQFELLLEIGGPSQEWIEDQRQRLEEITGKPVLDNRSYVVEAFIYETLVQFASKLGDKAAALTLEGHTFGVFSNLFTSKPWRQLRAKVPLSKKRLKDALNFVMLLDRIKIEYNWEWLVEHLCSTDEADADSQEPSCRAVINELYFEDMVSGPILEAVNKFEQVALELDVYD